MKQVLNRCTACGALTTYNIEKHAVGCPFCKTAEPLNLKSSYPQKSEYTENSKFEKLKENIEILKCTNCGSIYESKNETTNNCPSCGAGTFAVSSTISSIPTAVLPFSMPKEEIGKIFKKWTRRKFFAPNDLKKIKNFDSAEPIYYPSVAFDSENHFSYSGVGVNRITNSKGETKVKRTHFSDSFDTTLTNKIIPATNQISQVVIDKIQPFNLSNCTSFDKRYLYGFSALDTSLQLSDCYNKLTSIVQSENINHAKSEQRFRFDAIENLTGTTTLTNTTSALCFIPIWKTSYTYKKRKYSCFINGTTGKISGNAPISKLKVSLFTIGIIALVAGIITLLTLFI